MKNTMVAIACLVLLSGCQSSGLSRNVDVSGKHTELAEKAMRHAQKGDYVAAEKYLLAALVDSGPNPVYAFNLGLIEAKAGNPVLSSAWLNTYLAMAPDAANATQVKRLLTQNQLQARKAIGQMVEQQFKAARVLPEVKKADEFMMPKKVNVLERVVATAAELELNGLKRSALKAANDAGNRMGYSGSAYAYEGWETKFQIDRAKKAGDFVWFKALQPKSQEPVYPEGLLTQMATNGSASEAAKLYMTLSYQDQEGIWSPSYIVNQLVYEGKYAEAARFAEAVGHFDGRYFSQASMMDHALLRGDLADAREWARECAYSSNESVRASCLAMGGDPSLVMAYYGSGKSRACELCTPYTFELADLTVKLLLIGDTYSAKKTAALAQSLSKSAEYDDERDAAKRAQAYLELANQNLSAVNRYLNNAEDHWRMLFLSKAIPYAIFNWPADKAHPFIQSHAMSKDLPMYLTMLAEKSADFGNDAMAMKLNAEAASVERENRQGWQPDSANQMDRVGRWYDLAVELSNGAWSQDISTVLTSLQAQSADDTIAQLGYVATEWQVSMDKMRALSRYLPAY